MNEDTTNTARDLRSHGVLAGLIATLMFIVMITGKPPVAERSEADTRFAMPHYSLLVATPIQAVAEKPAGD